MTGADAFHSSQSVARLNTGWSNDVKMGPRRNKGGFAGRDDLEAGKLYRGGGRDDRYGMVFDVPGDDRHYRRKSRSRSPRRDRDEHRRRKSRSPRRERERERGSRRSRSRDREVAGRDHHRRR